MWATIGAVWPSSAAGSWWQRHAVAAAIAVLALALMVWQVIVRGPFVAWDWPLHAYVDPRQPTDPARWWLDSLANVGGQRMFTLPVLFGVAMWVSRRQQRWNAVWAACTGVATVFVIGYGLKLALARTPPHTEVDILGGQGQAFPSGHAANGALTWFLVLTLLYGASGRWPDRRRFRLWSVVVLAFVVGTGLLMTLLDYHWFSDIVGGWVLGILALALACLVLDHPNELGTGLRARPLWRRRPGPLPDR